MARFLGPAGRGEIAYSFLLMSVGSTVAYFGIDYATTIALSHDASSNRGTYRFMMALATATATAAAAGACIFAVVAQRPLSLPAVSGGIVAFTLLRISVAAALATRGAYLVGRARAVAGLAYLTTVTALLVTTVDPRWLLWAWVAVALGQSVVVGSMANRRLPAGKPDRQMLFAFVREGHDSWYSALTQLVTYRLDQLLVLLFLGPAALGEYAVAAFLMSMLWLVPDTIGEIEYPAGVQLNSLDRRRRVLQVGIRVAAVVGAGAAVTTAVASRFHDRILGPGYTDIPLLLFILAPGTVALAFGKVAGAGLLSGRQSSKLRRATLQACILASIATPLAVQFGGVIGTATCTSMVYCVLSIQLARYALRDER